MDGEEAFVTRLWRARATRVSRDAPAEVADVLVSGVVRASDLALSKETRGVFEASTWGELVERAHLAARHMENVGLFDSVKVIVARASPPSNGKGSVGQWREAKDRYTVCLLAEEAAPLSVNLFVGTDNKGEAEATASAARKNALGNGESVSASGTWGVRGTALYNIDASAPLLGWQRWAGVSASLYRLRQSMASAGFSGLETGLSSRVRWRPFGGFLQTNLGYTLLGRQLDSLAGAPFEVRQQNGPSLKSAIEASLSFDSLDSRTLASRGLLAKYALEKAGDLPLGGDVGLWKQSVELRYVLPFLLGSFIGVSLNCAHVQPTSGRTLSMADRLYLGGATSLRGFGHGRVGESRGGFHVGGMSSWAAGVHLFRPAPLLPALHGHLFASVGNLCSLSYDTQDTTTRLFESLLDRPRASVGAGLALRVSELARLELNYCWPVSFRASDQLVPGLQFGIGIDFL